MQLLRPGAHCTRYSQAFVWFTYTLQVESKGWQRECVVFAVFLWVHLASSPLCCIGQMRSPTACTVG